MAQSWFKRWNTITRDFTAATPFKAYILLLRYVNFRKSCLIRANNLPIRANILTKQTCVIILLLEWLNRINRKSILLISSFMWWSKGNLCPKKGGKAFLSKTESRQLFHAVLFTRVYCDPYSWPIPHGTPSSPPIQGLNRLHLSPDFLRANKAEKFSIVAY